MSGASAVREVTLCSLLSPMAVMHLAFVVVSLLSLGAAAPTDNCSLLNQPLAANELQQILGRWIFIEGTANDQFFDIILENVESMWMTLNTTADDKMLLLDQANRIRLPNEKQKYQCLRVGMNATLTDGKDLEFYLPLATTYHKFLQTCSDCLLMHIYNKENNFQMLYLFGRNDTVAPSDLENFRKQAACLKFDLPSKFHYDTSKEQCPVD